jgi:hypothetical protein
MGKAIEDFWYSGSTRSWKDVISNALNYKKPHIANGANTRKDFAGKLFLYPTFLTVGRHEYIIRSPGLTPTYMFNTTISDIRTEDPPSCKSHIKF